MLQAAVILDLLCQIMHKAQETKELNDLAENSFELIIDFFIIIILLFIPLIILQFLPTIYKRPAPHPPGFYEDVLVQFKTKYVV